MTISTKRAKKHEIWLYIFTETTEFHVIFLSIFHLNSTNRRKIYGDYPAVEWISGEGESDKIILVRDSEVRT